MKTEIFDTLFSVINHKIVFQVHENVNLWSFSKFLFKLFYPAMAILNYLRWNFFSSFYNWWCCKRFIHVLPSCFGDCTCFVFWVLTCRVSQNVYRDMWKFGNQDIRDLPFVLFRLHSVSEHSLLMYPCMKPDETEPFLTIQFWNFTSAPLPFTAQFWYIYDLKDVSDWYW